MKSIIVALAITILTTTSITAQERLKKIEGSGIHTHGEMYVNEEGDIFSKVFYVAFEKHITDDISQAKNISSQNIKSKFMSFKNVFSEFEANRSLKSMERLHPQAIPNDTVRYNKKGELVTVNDYSKIYKLIFNDFTSLQLVQKYFDVPNVKYIEQPPIYYTTSTSPNDPYFDNQWTHKIIESEKVFDITEGDPNLVIGISDSWSTSSTGGVHEDLIGRVLAYEHGKWVNTTYSHGPRIALIAAATNNNNTGISSLAGNMGIVISGYGYNTNNLNPGLPYLRDICNDPQDPTGCAEFPDIINMSWIGGNSPTTKAYLQDLLNLGVILVAGAGNYGDPPTRTYPSAYEFNNGEQVISVTATQLTDNVWNFDPLEPPIDPFQYEERFRWEDGSFIFNYGLDNDPINNPDSAFIDVAAPAGWIFTARGEFSTETGSQNEYRAGGGATSEATPIVTSIIAMMLSVNPNLSSNDVYDILTSTTDYNNIVVPSGSVTNNLPDGRKYNKYVGFGRVNAYRAVKEALPNQFTNHTFTGSLTLGSSHIDNAIIYSGVTLTVPAGEVVVLEDHINSSGTDVFMNVEGRVVINEGARVERVHFKVEDGGELIIQPGAELEFSTGQWHNIRVNAGGKITAHGTEDDPIYFKRKSSGTAWGQIGLLSSEGNSFKWAVFDGGNKTVEVRSNNNTFEHCTFKNGVRGISGWTNLDGTGNSDFTCTYCLVENNTTVGIVNEYTDADISYSTIRNNTQAGVYVSASEVSPFHHNVVTENGNSWRDGIEVTSSGTFYAHSGNLMKGYNEIYNNLDDQISGSGDLFLGQLYPGAGGYNHISGNYSGSKYLIDNNSGVSVQINYNYFGGASPSTSTIDGSYNYFYLSSSNPTTGQSPGAGTQVPSKIIGGQTNEFVSSIDAYNEAFDALPSASSGQEVRDLLYKLYQIAETSKDASLKKRFKDFSNEAGNGAMISYSSNNRNKELRNFAKVLHVKSLLRSGNYSEARTYIGSINSSSLDGYNKRDWLHFKVVTETYHENYEAAWNALQKYYAFQESQGEDMEEVRAINSTIEESLLDFLDGKNDSPVKKAVLEDKGISLSAYPNPFNPSTTISFELTEATDVTLKVYDLLGREVSTLVNGWLSAQTHSYLFDASNLSSGIYIYISTTNREYYHYSTHDVD